MSTKTTVAPSRAPLPLKTVTKSELISLYNELSNSISSLNMAVTIRLTAGSTYSGTIEQYREINGFILAQKPASIRVIGQVPVVGKNIFDMESDGEMFHIFIPSKNQFLVGPANLERPSTKPIENLRPQHLLDAIFWKPSSPAEPVLLEELPVPPASFYVLTLIRVPRDNGTADAPTASSQDWAIDRKIWFDRTNLELARIEIYDASGTAVSIVRFSAWDMFGTVRYPKQIFLDRPANDYQLQLMISKLTSNESITPDRFDLPQPVGTELVRLGEDAPGTGSTARRNTPEGTRP